MILRREFLRCAARENSHPSKKRKEKNFVKSPKKSKIEKRKKKPHERFCLFVLLNHKQLTFSHFVELNKQRRNKNQKQNKNKNIEIE
jgi:hypothetical protein